MSVSYQTIEHYSWENGGKPQIRTTGCSCCSSTEPMTPELLEDAIKDAEEWAEELRAFRGRENEVATD